MDNNELMHWGKKGMKWGVRRYQNADGTLTPAGKKRYDRDIQENNAKKKENRIIIDGPDANRWVKEDIRRTKGIFDESGNVVKELQKIDRSISSKSKNKRMDLSNMSDKEMRDRINRELLERQYNDVFNPQKVSKGRAAVTSTLNAIGTGLTIAGSAAALAVAIKELKG